MPLIATGLNHRSADVELRERVSFTPDVLPDALSDLVSLPQVEEGLIVSTCNRTDIYTVGGQPDDIRGWVAQFRRVPRHDFTTHSYTKEGEAAAQHALRVACGLDSMVLGETQILGQMKHAWQLAQRGGVLGPVLERLFQHAFGTAKVVRHSTALGAGQVSVASSAARIAGEIFGSLKNLNVLVLGAGDTAELMVRYLLGLGQPRITIANRSLDRAQKLAREYDAAACSLDALPQFLGAADIIVGCMTIDHPYLARAQLKSAFTTRKRKPVLMLDLGVPRNFATDVAADPDVFLYGVDDLQSRVDAGTASREAAAVEAERIVDARTREFAQWLASRELDLGLSQLESTWKGELAILNQRALARLQAGDDPAEVLQRLQNNTLQRLLHQPRRHVREMPAEQRGRAVQNIQRAFRLDSVDDDSPPHS